MTTYLPDSCRNPEVHQIIQQIIRENSLQPNKELLIQPLNLKSSAPAIYVSNQKPTQLSAPQRTAMYILNVTEICFSQIKCKKHSAIDKNIQRLTKREKDLRQLILGCQVPILDPRIYRKHQRICDRIKVVMEEVINKNPEYITHISYCCYLCERLWERTPKEKVAIRDNLKWLLMGLNTLYNHLFNELDKDLQKLEPLINAKAIYYGDKLLKAIEE